MIRAALRLLRRLRAFAVRRTLRALSFARLMDPRLQLEWLLWLRDDIHPLHPHLPEVLRTSPNCKEPAVAENLCLPTGPCSHRCQQGKDCEGSRQATLRSLGLRRAALELTPDDLDAGRKALIWGCSVCAGNCPTPEACQLPVAASPLPPHPFPTTREGWCSLIGAVLGIAAFSFLAGFVGRYMGLF